MKSSAKPRFILDGKPVHCWLFARMIRMPNGRQIPDMIQVEGFDLDHAWRRLKEHRKVGAGKWEMLSELEPEHNVGYLGEKLPLLPTAANDGKYWVH